MAKSILYTHGTTEFSCSHFCVLWLYNPGDQNKVFGPFFKFHSRFCTGYRSKQMVFPVPEKERPLQRYNDQGCRLVVGCIPYRFKAEGNETNNEVEVLVISSPKSQEMMFPKGGWELDESIKEAASRETLEEAGVVGNVEHELGKWIFKSKSQEIFHEGHMFSLLVTEELDLWPDVNLRKREWMTVAGAREVCKQWWMNEALDRLVNRLPSPDDLSAARSFEVKEIASATPLEQSIIPAIQANLEEEQEVLPSSQS